jgi:ABC-2 type transport system ATP-binding protein
VVDDLTLHIPTGAVAGFIGPNGAGKTTTMAMLLGLVHPSGGSGTVLGAPLSRPGAYLDRVGALIEGPGLWPGLSGTENLRVLATLAGQERSHIPDVLALVGLADRAGDRYGEYSLGMKQRLGIAAALLGDPELLVLDEPTNGLDPVGINEMRNLIGAISGGDRTVLVSSHILSELEQVCDWLIVIDAGALLYVGPTEGFLGSGSSVVTIVPERDADVARLAEIVSRLGHSPRRDGASVTVPVNGSEPRALAAELNRAAMQEGIVLAGLHSARPSLEAHYLSVLEGADR